MITLNTLLENVAYGTTVVLAESETEKPIGVFVMTKDLRYKKKFETYEPYLDSDVIVISTTTVGGLYIEIL